MNVRTFLVSLLILSRISLAFTQTDFYATDTLQQVEITFDQPNWDYQMDTSKYGNEGYILASSIKINGALYDSVGVKYKGYSSYDSSRVKNPLHIKLDYIHSGYHYNGVEDIKLSNGFSDPSCIREVLSYEILRNYMDAPKSNFARVFINGEYYGIYSSSEDISKSFLSKKFNSSGNTFIKCNPASVVSGQIPNLLYLGTDSANYYSRYELKSAFKWKDLIDLCDTICNKPIYADSILDIDRSLWMIAFNNVLVNLDSYTGAFSQNYYLYRDDNRRFVPVIWDLNMSFGAFPNTGSGTLNISGMKQMSPVLHSANGARPLIMKLLSIPTYYRMYLAHMRTILAENFSNGNYLSRSQQLQALIDTSLQAETHSLYSYSQFQSSLNANTGNIPGIAVLMGARDTFLRATSQFQQVAPVISNVVSSPSIINLNDTVWVTCQVSGADSVLLGYRDNIWDRFRRRQMFDDGLHQDGSANDSIFGTYLAATSSEIQYYIYAENQNAGMFSPERAEHEYYQIQVNVITPLAGEIVINELLALNVNDTINEFGLHEDWIELHNTTNVPLNLYGLYLSDDVTIPKRFALPNKVIQPQGYEVIWADGKTSTTQYTHCGFSLSALGETLIISDGNGVLDSVIYGQQVQDSSFGRCPDGTGTFIRQATSFGALNPCNSPVEEYDLTVKTIRVYPNPANSLVHIYLDNEWKGELSVFDSLGRLVFSTINKHEITLPVSHWSPGAYIIRTGQLAAKLIITGE